MEPDGWLLLVSMDLHQALGRTYKLGNLPAIESWRWPRDVTGHAQRTGPHQGPVVLGCKNRSLSAGGCAVIGCNGLQPNIKSRFKC
jgi:hypothetical protein